MSQDNEVCVKCGVESGYDDGKGNWNVHNKVICRRCKDNLANRFSAFFGLESASYGREGLELEWPEVDKILSRIKRDYLMYVSYIVTDKELYERTTKQWTPVEQG